ncbi:MAG: UTP--glucose-1-phosphate uridylyltransferase GalU [Pseudomonadales bacterium]|nr:UTP--glucose-1-phosphate uridylyltransferase GalU [Pseudomonadales bacterium]MBO6595996.1 UTP--glucose-1-phosphate uridylyltransferase GalU [Pseudomonadales bacterium]MBO6702613.1 UTP--glucose-1-phosphate uridylyltransferase GalU [Pseudomonadales bacterium]MBO6822479.1 UTP--glucose-1-phosphate uridylyltransferase GalU [Pseudomonadales bacterium]MBO7004773.1 UTP--glucose-1-phosphate uridylyltransferase GalU [Pseudomonadales bacterium]
MLTKCLFPAAGYGTRFLPATKAMPKEMLPIVNKPLIQYGVEEAIEAGLIDIGVISGRGKRAIEDHFDISYELEHQIAGTSKDSLLEDIREVIDQCTFSYTRQIEMKGLGHAILTGERLVGDNPFGVLLADDFCTNGTGVLKQMVDLFNEYQCSIVAIEEVPADQTDRYGIIEGKEIQDGLFKISNMIEKPNPVDAPTSLAIIGRYILTPDIFDILRTQAPGAGGEVQITDAINEQCKKRMVLGYKFHGRRFDCGSIDGFVEATNYVYENMNS